MQNLWKKEKPLNSVNQYVDLFVELKNITITTPDRLCENVKCWKKNNKQSSDFRALGDIEYLHKEWDKAMNWYNQSLCFAEIGSMNIALAYASRSACFFHMQKYRQALIDIELAEKAMLPDHLSSEIDQRKRECENFLSVVERTIDHTAKLSYETSRNFPGLANVIEMKTSSEFGRHFVANCDIPVGKIILKEEQFIGVRKDSETMYCCQCLQVRANFIACKQCTNTLFCDEKCIELNTCHKFECGTQLNLLHHEVKYHMHAIFMAIEAFQNIEQLIRFIDQYLIDAKNVPMSLQDSKSKYGYFFTLSKSLPTADDIFLVNKIYTDLLNIPKILELFDSEVKRRFLMHLVAHHFLIILNNTHGGRSYQSLGLIFSMFNHSCAPNLLQYFDKRQHLVTIRPVKNGDQLFICYLGKGNQLLDERRTALKSNWNFLCKCERCNLIERTIDYTFYSDPYYEFVLNNGYKEEKSIEVLKMCTKFLNKYGHLPWSEEIQFVINIYCAHIVKNNLIVKPKHI